MSFLTREEREFFAAPKEIERDKRIELLESLYDPNEVELTMLQKALKLKPGESAKQLTWEHYRDSAYMLTLFDRIELIAAQAKTGAMTREAYLQFKVYLIQLLEKGDSK